MIYKIEDDGLKKKKKRWGWMANKREWCDKHQAFHRCSFDKKRREQKSAVSNVTKKKWKNEWKTFGICDFEECKYCIEYKCSYHSEKCFIDEDNLKKDKEVENWNERI